MNWSSADDVSYGLNEGESADAYLNCSFRPVPIPIFHLHLIDALYTIFLLQQPFTDAKGCAYNLTLCTADTLAGFLITNSIDAHGILSRGGESYMTIALGLPANKPASLLGLYASGWSWFPSSRLQSLSLSRWLNQLGA